MAGGAILLYFTVHAAESSMRVTNLMIFYAGPLLSLALGVVYRSGCRTMTWYHRWARWLFTMSLALVFGAGLLYQTSFAFGSAPPYRVRERFRGGKLTGLAELHARKDALETLLAEYERNGCRQKVFLTFANTPLLYYLFERAAPARKAWTHPDYSFPEWEMLETLRAPGWCVVVSRNFLSDRQWAKMRALLDYLASHSTRILQIGDDQEWFSRWTIYVSSLLSKLGFTQDNLDSIRALHPGRLARRRPTGCPFLAAKQRSLAAPSRARSAPQLGQHLAGARRPPPGAERKLQ